MANLAQSLRMALHYAEENLELTNVFGEDVGPPLGGVFTGTQGVKCAWNSPLDERGIIGAAMGLGFAQKRCVAEIQFCDYIYNTIDLLKLAGNTCWSSNGDWNLPITVMTPVGSGIRGSIYHSHSFDATMTHIPGWKIVMPSTPRDAYGLMLACIKDPNPCMFLKPKALMYMKGKELIDGEPEDPKVLKGMIDAPLDVLKGTNKTWKPKWPELSDPELELGKAKIVQGGEHVTLVSYGRTQLLCEQVAAKLAGEGISVESIDLRTLWPYDWATLSESIRKTRRVVYVNEDTEVTNFGEHLLRRTVEEHFYELEARPKLLAGEFTPGIGLADNLEQASVPQAGSIEAAVREVVSEVA